MGADYEFFNKFQLDLYSNYGCMLDKLRSYPNFWHYNNLSHIRSGRNFFNLYSHNYYLEYAKRFDKKRDTALKVLEVGVFQGFSILLWEKYFTKAEIYGIDITLDTKWLNKTPVDLLKDKKRVHLFEFDACRKENVDKFLKENGGEFDIIIDDGSHLGHHQILTTLYYLPLLKRDGIMVIEDIGLFYNAEETEYIHLCYQDEVDVNYPPNMDRGTEKEFNMPVFEYFMLNYKNIKKNKDHKLYPLCQNTNLEILDEIQIDWIEPLKDDVILDDVDIKGTNSSAEIIGNSKMAFITYKKYFKRWS